MTFDLPGEFLDAVADQLAPRLADRLASVVPAAGGSPWMAFEEAVEYTKIPPGTFRKLSADGTIPAHGGKRKLYHRDELDRALRGSLSSPAVPGKVTPLRKAG